MSQLFYLLRDTGGDGGVIILDQLNVIIEELETLTATVQEESVSATVSEELIAAATVIESESTNVVVNEETITVVVVCGSTLATTLGAPNGASAPVGEPE